MKAHMGVSAFLKKLWVKNQEPPAAPEITVAPPKAEVIVKKSEAPSPPAPRPAPKVTAPTSPYALTGGAKNQSDWLLLQVGKTGRAFIAAADKQKLTIVNPPVKEGTFVRHDMTAALLGYRLVLTAYHFHQDVPSLEALRIVRTAMTGMLHRAVDLAIERSGNKAQRAELLAAAEEQFRSADKEIQEACFQLRGKSLEPFFGFYAGLVPAFGEETEAHALHQRFGATLNDLYQKIESAMLARNHQITG